MLKWHCQVVHPYLNGKVRLPIADSLKDITTNTKCCRRSAVYFDQWTCPTCQCSRFSPSFQWYGFASVYSTEHLVFLAECHNKRQTLGNFLHLCLVYRISWFTGLCVFLFSVYFCQYQSGDLLSRRQRWKCGSGKTRSGNFRSRSQGLNMQEYCDQRIEQIMLLC